MLRSTGPDAAEGDAAWPRIERADRLAYRRLQGRRRTARKSRCPRGRRSAPRRRRSSKSTTGTGSMRWLSPDKRLPGAGNGFGYALADRVDGRWLNQGNDSRRTLEDARQKIQESRSH